MTTIDPLHPLQSSIIETLATRRNVSIPALRLLLRDEHNIDTSLQNLYRAVGQMLTKQILVREKTELSLNFSWIVHYLQLGETIRGTYCRSEAVADLPKKEGKSSEYRASSLSGIDPIWTDLLTRVVAVSEGDTLYEYASHPYFFLGSRDTESNFLKGISGRSINCYQLHGNDTFLDRYGTRLVSHKRMRAVTSTDTGFPAEGHVVSVFGPYIVECTFPDVIADRFAVFFRTVHSVSALDIELFSSIFSMKAEFKVAVRRSKREASNLARRIRAYFQDE